MQFPVPQFIDVEDKIIGPFTLKQFGFIFGGGIIILGFFKLIGTGFFFYLLSFPVAIVAMIFAFGSYNGMKLYNFLPVLIKFVTSDRTLIFEKRRADEQIVIKPLTQDTFSSLARPEASIQEPVQSRLKKLALSLDQKNVEEIEAIKVIKKPNA